MQFATRDPGRPEFWDERYRAGFTPWDARGVPAPLVDFVERGAPGRRVLVPGCGAAYEAGCLDARGFEVTAIDIAPVALERARAVLGEPVARRVLRQADYFEIDLAVDWIYERALLCALPPRLWTAWAGATARLLPPGGRLAGFFFLDEGAPEPRRGPPFPARRAELDALLGAAFECVEQQALPAEQSIPVFAGREHWMVWRRRDVAPGPAENP